ncbi:Nop16 protein [Martiniozyma asiatica (nom. inval.)]|nr:Nop16 protein [Martiniozyma asiatica]
MVSVRKRKMARSGVQKQTRRTNKSKKDFNPKSNPIIAKHWDSNLTVKQNYKKLGLTMSLGRATGGEEKKLVIPQITRNNDDENLEDEDEREGEGESENQDSNGDQVDPYDPANILEGTAKIIKDEDGKVIKIVYGTKKPNSSNNKNNNNSNKNSSSKSSNTNDTTNVENEEDNSLAKQVISELEELAAREKKKEFHPLNEVEFARYAKLDSVYGDDFEKMKWDRKLNPFQLSAGQLKKKIHHYHQQLELQK